VTGKSILLVSVFRAAAQIELLGIESQAGLVEAILDCRLRDVPRIRQTVDIADLVPVVRRDRYLRDAIPGLQELEDDLVVKVEVVRVAKVGKAPETREVVYQRTSVSVIRLPRAAAWRVEPHRSRAARLTAGQGSRAPIGETASLPPSDRCLTNGLS
jgi:hypothetical protein